jgi:ribosomal protein S7
MKSSVLNSLIDCRVSDIEIIYNELVENNKLDTNTKDMVERFINKIMGSGHKGKKHVYTSEKNTGKAQTAYKIFQNALEIVEMRSKKLST